MATNCIKRHLAVDMLGFPFFTLCMPVDVSDDVGLIELVNAQHLVLSSETSQYPQNHYLVRQRLLP